VGLFVTVESCLFLNALILDQWMSNDRKIMDLLDSSSLVPDVERSDRHVCQARSDVATVFNSAGNKSHSRNDCRIINKSLKIKHTQLRAGTGGEERVGLRWRLNPWKNCSVSICADCQMGSSVLDGSTPCMTLRVCGLSFICLRKWEYRRVEGAAAGQRRQ